MYNKNESIEHSKIKKYLFDNIPLNNPIKVIEQEYRISDQVADIYIELIDHKKIALEIQHSKITRKDLINRTKNYNQKNIYVLWILNGNGPYYYRVPKNEQGVIISSSERELHRMYQGRLYYMNMAKDEIIAPIYSVHFASYYRKKITPYGTIQYKRSSIKRTIAWSLLPSLSLKIFKNVGLQLARFSDQSLKDQCKNDLIHLLNAFVVYQSQNSQSTKKKGLPLGYVIRRFSKLYDKFLLFDVLRELKFLRNHDIKYILNKELQFRKYLLS
ncbi:MAG: competence protein CoiA family protein [Candidatus Hodarchaeota archaeon]